MEFAPWFGSVTFAVKVPSAGTVAVASATPLSVKVTAWPTTAALPPDVTVPVIVWPRVARFGRAGDSHRRRHVVERVDDRGALPRVAVAVLARGDDAVRPLVRQRHLRGKWPLASVNTGADVASATPLSVKVTAWPSTVALPPDVTVPVIVCVPGCPLRPGS